MGLPANLTQTTVADLEALIAGQIAEDAHLEFKRELPVLAGNGRNEFLADLSAFANSGGGDVIFGMDEDAEGRASQLVAQPGVADEQMRRFLDVLMNGIDPRVPGVEAHTVAVPGGFVLLFRIRQSWIGPHRLSTNQHFFIREGGRKRQLNMPEIKGLFLRSDSQAQRVRNFRTERIGKLVSGEAPLQLAAGSIFVVHLVPIQAVMGQVQIDPVPYTHARALPALGMSAGGARLNVDGALGFRTLGQRDAYAYSLFFRDGYFETVKVLTSGNGRDGRTLLPSVRYEDEFIRFYTSYLAELAHYGIAPETLCMVSIVGAKVVELGIDRFRFNFDDTQGRFDRDILVLPDVLLEPGNTPAKTLRPVFDLIWQSAGIARSINYNAEGDWAPPN